MINRLAISTLPVDIPAFLRSEAAIREIEYLGPEPDRWRSPAEPELNAAQAPEHFPRRRLDFEAKAFAGNQRPEKIGLQPWEGTEVWERTEGPHSASIAGSTRCTKTQPPPSRRPFSMPAGSDTM